MEFLIYTIIFLACLFTALILFSLDVDSWFIDRGIAVMFLGCIWATLKVVSLVGRY